ncbi:MAG: hypothetical protein JSR28_13625 [Proteobacteria bacterium]|nr:hypothetical protein [Pseudomonadota bacterium]
MRAGAVERAWELFVGEGHDARANDPSVQTVRGRLLKARARLASGDARTALFGEAAAAYAAAHAHNPAPYLAINAATLYLLAGNDDAARTGASQVLTTLDGPVVPADTPYYLAATRAEACFLLGDRDAAERAMQDATRHDPDGWSDRATTIAQLREIAQARGESTDWLDRFAPPASLHFAGHMGLAASGQCQADLAAEVDKLIEHERIGFAWGALAAGSDVVIAERLLAAGAELHIVLPCGAEQFEAQSVAPAGPAWQERYRAVLAHAASLRFAASDPGAVHDPLATAHAGELAIGATLLNATALAAACCQLIVTDSDGGGRNTAHQAAMWPGEAGRQLRLTIDRDTRIEALFPPEQPDPHRALVVHVAIALDELTRTTSLDSSAIAARVAPIAEALAGIDRARVRSSPGRWDLAIDNVDAALETILKVLARCRAAGLTPPSIGAHVAIASLIEDPASGALVPYGPGRALAARLQAMAPTGLALISDALAVTMVARGIVSSRSELYHAGDEDTDGAVHVLLKA